MKIQPSSETTVSLSPAELAILTFVMQDKGEMLKDILKPMFRYFVRNINELDDSQEDEYTIKAELPAVMHLMDLLEANYQSKAIMPLKEMA
jgi:hypothetical protein